MSGSAGVRCLRSWWTTTIGRLSLRRRRQSATAMAQARTLRAQRELQLANIEAARAAVASAVALREQNARDLTRQQRLLQTGSSSTESREKLETTQAQLVAQLAQSRAQALAAERGLAVLDGQLEQAEASLASARAALATARLNLQYTTITAPQDGVIGRRQIKPGQLVGVGTPGHHPYSSAGSLGGRKLQGDPDHPHGGRAEGRDQGG